MEYCVALATGNPGKAREIAEIFAGLDGPSAGLRVMTLKEAIGDVPETDETGDTLEDNALIKARAAAAALKARRPGDCGRFITAADDSGLFVDYLGGRPGVRSARYGLEAAPARASIAPQEQIRMLLAEMESAPHNMRKASFRCAVAIVFPDGVVKTVEGECAGEIALAPAGGNGFGYDPVFYLPGAGCTMAELTGSQKNEISHRGAAVRRMAREIDVFFDGGAR